MSSVASLAQLVSPSVALLAKLVNSKYQECIIMVRLFLYKTAPLCLQVCCIKESGHIKSLLGRNNVAGTKSFRHSGQNIRHISIFFRDIGILLKFGHSAYK